jgi:Ca2+ transporting ATPase
LRILLLAATVSLIIGVWKDGVEKGWYEGVTIYFAVIIIVTVTACNDYLKDKQFRKLMDARKDRKILVLRNNGTTKYISTYDLLVGDIILLKQGDHIPADCLMIEGDELETDESNITGETEHVKKIPLNGEKSKVIPNPFLLADSMVVLGKATAVVCAVGINTRTGEVEEKLFENDTEGTPLQQKLERVADFIGKIGMYVAVLTFIALTINAFLSRILSNQKIFSMSITNQLIDAVILSITIVVVAVPEGLPLAVTLSLAYSVN